ncbi:MAG: hypothetical protein LKF36_07885 [Lactobacillus sp.]|jgi:hypothetical protein|nr:hypothetical protein [Lactobacillus sp.]
MKRKTMWRIARAYVKWIQREFMTQEIDLYQTIEAIRTEQRLPMAYTTIDYNDIDEGAEVQVWADIKHLRLIAKISTDEAVIYHKRNYKSLVTFIEDIEAADFNDLTYM